MQLKQFSWQDKHSRLEVSPYFYSGHLLTQVVATLSKNKGELHDKHEVAV